MIMVIIDNLQRMAIELKSADEALKKISHYKVNRKIYEMMRTIEHSDIAYYAQLNTLVLNGKPVFIDDELEDGIATYQQKELEHNELIDIYSPSMVTIMPSRIKPIVLSGII